MLLENVDCCFSSFYEAEMDYNLKNTKSRREHIKSADSTINSVMDLLASSQPGKLIQYSVDSIEYVKELG